MAEIFRREVAASPEPFTGERLTGTLAGQTQIEHYHRYLFARAFCRDRDVLDVASGEGYGSAQLAQVARSVVGVEYSATTVANATANFVRPNLTFLQGDARALPLRDSCVDVVVSFETIEHFDRHEAFLAEVRRVLRSDGCFIVSTPDRDIYSPPGSPRNPFHVLELTRAEFVTLLRRHFTHVEILAQRPILGSALVADTGSAAPPLVFDRHDAEHFAACATLPHAPYLVAVAANRAVAAPPHSLFIERSDIDRDAHLLVERTRELDITRTVATQARADADRARATAERAADELAEAARRIATLERDLDTARGSLRTFLRTYLPRLRHHVFGRTRR